MNKFNVLTWDFNKDTVEPYDVMPYFRRAYAELVERHEKYGDSDVLDKIPVTFEEVRDFIKRESQYQFWARCEYEFIMHGWPVKRNTHKIDVHEQIMMNLDIIAKMFYDEL